MTALELLMLLPQPCSAFSFKNVIAIFIFLTLLRCMCLGLHFSVHTCSQCLWRPEAGIGPPRATVADTCDRPLRVLEISLKSSARAARVLNPKAPCSPWSAFSWWLDVELERLFAHLILRSWHWLFSRLSTDSWIIHVSSSKFLKKILKLKILWVCLCVCASVSRVFCISDCRLRWP